MNTANLQLEGLYLVIAAMHETMISKGLVSRQEVDDAMRAAEQTAINDNRSVENLRPAERDALAFPARLLRVANATVADDVACEHQVVPAALYVTRLDRLRAGALPEFNPVDPEQRWTLAVGLAQSI